MDLRLCKRIWRNALYRQNDDGDVVGISDKDSRKLLEVIPNKITDTMGIVADVNLLYEGDLQYIEIIVEKYPSLISYHGKYFYRFWQHHENNYRKRTG